MQADQTKTCPQCGQAIPADARECPNCGYSYDAPKRKSSPVLLIFLLLVLAGLGAFLYLRSRPQVEVYWVSREQGRAFGEVKNLTDKPIKDVYVVSLYEGPAPEGDGTIRQETVPMPIPGVIQPGKAGRFVVPMSAEIIKGFRIYSKEGEDEKEFPYSMVADRKSTTTLPE